ncbi:MAG: glycosyltransferase [Candidatus Binatia bacterium]|nr:glycosyltransferase [Candidatus Binatia bacterium]
MATTSFPIATASAPLVSVLLPVRNGARTLAAALQSVRKQQGVAWECVCIDDNSTDETPAILAHFARMDCRFRWFPSPGTGIVEALQFGLTHCRGNLIARMDADDVMHPRRLAEQAGVFAREPHILGVACRVRAFPVYAVGTGFQRYLAWLDTLVTSEAIWRERFIECPVVHPTLMWSCSTLQRFPYRETTWPEDYDLILRILESGGRIACLPERLHFWRMHSLKTSLNSARYSLEEFTRCKAHYLARGPLSGNDEYVLWGYGRTGRRLCRALWSEGKRPRAVIDVHPRRLGVIVAGAPVVSPEALPSLADLPLLVSVANTAARAQIRKFLQRSSRQEGRDWWFTA